MLNPAAALTQDEKLEEVRVTAQQRSIYGDSVSIHSGDTLTGIVAKELGTAVFESPKSDP